jgi:hypothetical protein
VSTLDEIIEIAEKARNLGVGVLPGHEAACVVDTRQQAAGLLIAQLAEAMASALSPGYDPVAHATDVANLATIDHYINTLKEIKKACRETLAPYPDPEGYGDSACGLANEILGIIDARERNEGGQ